MSIVLFISGTNFIAGGGKLEASKGYFLADSTGEIIIPDGYPFALASSTSEVYRSEFKVSYGPLEFLSPFYIASGGTSGEVVPANRFLDPA